MKPSPSIQALQQEHRACTACVAAGYLRVAAPVFSGNAAQRIMLVGQAPGKLERDVHRPFAGRAGKELMRWMVRAGFASEAEFRSQVFITSMTTCFPGASPSGGGDRRPSMAEVRLCARWLDGYLELLQPRLIIIAGTLALRRFLPGQTLESAVGRVWSDSAAGSGPQRMVPVILPLPHPSGQSRWLNDADHKARLQGALEHLDKLRRGALGIIPDSGPAPPED